MARLRNIVQPFEPWIDEASRILILGSFPSVKAVAAGYYYGNPNNRFYDVLEHLLGTRISGDALMRRTVLLSHHIGIYDVIFSCTITGSSDASIRDVRIAAIEQLMVKYRIRHIFINGLTAGRLFDKWFPQFREQRTILPSTSPANARMRLDDLVRAWSPVLAYL
jgi:hypoxanthine-DNA glycosylase